MLHHAPSISPRSIERDSPSDQANTRSLNELLGKNRELREKNLRLQANLLHTDLLKIKPPSEFASEFGSITPLSKRTFQELVSSDLPTVALMAQGTFAGAPLCAMIAQQLRKTDSTNAINMMFVPCHSGGFLRLSREGSPHRLVAGEGLLLDARGTIHFGPFPTPVEIDLLHTPMFSEQMHREAQLMGVRSFDSQELRRSSRSKTLSKKLLTMAGFRTPPQIEITRELLHNDTKVRERINSFYSRYEVPPTVVVKPDLLDAGIGVQFVDSTDKDAVYQAIRSCARWLGSALLEPRIECLGGPNRNWNLRVIASKDQILRIAVRKQDVAGPVSGTSGASGALFNINYLTKLGLSKNASQGLIYKLSEMSMQVARLCPANVVALDCIIDQEQNIWALEVNSGRWGGLVFPGMKFQDAVDGATRVISEFRKATIEFGKELKSDRATPSVLLPMQWESNPADDTVRSQALELITAATTLGVIERADALSAIGRSVITASLHQPTIDDDIIMALLLHAVPAGPGATLYDQSMQNPYWRDEISRGTRSK